MARSPSPENVMDLIAKPTADYVPEPRYVSRYRDKIRRAAKRGKSDHKTLGVPNVALNPPGEFLRKQSSIPKKPEVHHEHYHKPGYQHKLPDWQPVKASEKDREASRSRVDFTKRNIEEAKNLRPLKPRKYYVDDRHGTVHALKPSGLFPTYRNRKSYGQVPGRNSPTMERPEPRQRNGAPSPHLEQKTKARRYEDKRVKREINDPRKNEHNRHDTKLARKHENNRDKHDMKSPRKHENNRDRHDVKSPRNHKNNRDRHDAKSPRNHQKNVDRHDVKSPRKDGAKQSTNQSKDPKKQDRKSADESKDESHEETDFEKKYEDDIEETGEMTEIRSLRLTGSVRKSVTHDGRDDDLASRASVQQPRCRYVTEDEREELLYGMKKKWDEMMKKFQCLPFLTDTPPKAKRKSAMEKDLHQLEKDIEIIERHPYIYVYSDGDDEC